MTFDEYAKQKGYTEDEKRFLISVEEREGQLCRSMEEMVIQAYRDGQKMAWEVMEKESPLTN